MKHWLTVLLLLPHFAWAQVVWEEDFSNGLNSTNGTWTVAGPQPDWKHSFYGTSGEWSTGTPLPAFTTTPNGFMLFDADSINFPLSPNYITPMGELISPPINLSGTSCVELQFQSYFRQCCWNATEGFTVSVTTDGNTWHDFPLPAGCQDINPTYERITLSSIAANEPNVQLKFTFGDSIISHYFWAIDDIKIMGGDSIVYPFNYELCEGDSLFVQGAWQKTDGVYIDTYPTTSGCDSVIETTVAFFPLPPPIVFQPIGTVCLTDSAVPFVVTPGSGYFSGPGAVNGPNARFEPSYAGLGTHTIYYRINVANDCMVYDSILVEVVDCSVGIEEQGNNDAISIYPNPNTGNCWVEGKGIQRWRLYDAVGREVASGTGTHRFNIQVARKGVFLLRLEQQNTIITRRIVVR